MRKNLTKHCVSLVVVAVLLFAGHLVQGQDAAFTGEKPRHTKTTYTYKVVDKHEILADVHRYPDDEIRPAILWLHGGALIFGSRHGPAPEQLERYLAAGYTIVSIDYRLAPETKLPGIIEDLEDAYAWVRAQGPELFNIDPDRIAVVGHSAGGYLTLMAGARLEPHPDALVAFYGYGDITGPWLTQPSTFHNRQPPISRADALETVGDNPPPAPRWSDGRPTFYRYCRQQGLWPAEVGGHDPEAEGEWFREYEPIRRITKTYPPTFLLHGETDTEVPFEQSVLMAAELKRQGVEYELITNPDWGHMFDGSWSHWSDKEVQDAFARVLGFLDKHVR